MPESQKPNAITVEYLDVQIAELSKQEAILLAQANQANGAIQICQQLRESLLEGVADASRTGHREVAD